jgi:hypothetical protein
MSIRSKYKTLYSRGLTLVETLVAVFILSLVIIPGLYVAYQGIGSAIYSNNQIVANYLAQDAMDFILTKKNENIIKCNTPSAANGNKKSDCDDANGGPGKDWLSDMRDCVGRNCYVNTTQTSIGGDYTNICPSNRCEPLKYDQISGRYSHTVGTPTQFTRTVRFERLNGGDAMAVAVTVAWNSSGFQSNRSFTLRTNIFNIKP